MNTDVQLTPLGWIVVGLALIGFNRSKTGHELIYYGLVLILLFLVVANYSQILKVLVKTPSQTGASGGSGGGSNHVLAQ